jgi:hypothetical protein
MAKKILDKIRLKNPYLVSAFDIFLFQIVSRPEEGFPCHLHRKKARFV